MSNESPVVKNLTLKATDVPRGAGSQGSVPLLVLLCVCTAALLLLLLSVLLIVCRRCSRTSNDPEKNNTTTYLTYLEDFLPVPEVTVGVEGSEQPSSSGHDAETERFLSTGLVARRVSFNEAALTERGRGSDAGRRAQERGRRYTLTEGDFHHLKKARLAHLHLPPPAPGVLTIHEWSSDQVAHPAPKPCLSTLQTEAMGGRGARYGGPPGHGGALPSFRGLRRHGSLDRPSPPSGTTGWSSDSRGSPKRHQFQRQRAASEGEEPVPPISSTNDEAPPPQQRFVAEVAVEPSGLAPPGPQEEEEELGLGAGSGAGPGALASFRQDSAEQHALYREIWTLRASLEQCASLDHSSNNDRDSVRSDADSVCSLGGGASRAGLSSCPSQDLGDEEGDGVAEPGNRKLLQMDSGYASIEAPPRGPDASEKRLFFTSAGRMGGVSESVEARLLQEEPEDPGAKPRPQPLRRRDYSIDEKTDALFNEFLRHDPRLDQQGAPARSRHRASRVHLRQQWQRAKQHSDPGSAAPSPPGPQSTPNPPNPPSPPLRRGDSANFPLDTRYHGTLPRIISVADEEASEADGQGGAGAEPGGGGTSEGVARGEPGEGGASEGVARAEPGGGGAREGMASATETLSLEASRAETEEDESSSSSNRTMKEEGDSSSPPPPDPPDPPPTAPGFGPQAVAAELPVKLAARRLELQIYTSFQRPRGSMEHAVRVTHISPDHSPV